MKGVHERYNMKTFQHEKWCDMKIVHHKKKFMMKTLWYGKSKT